LPDGYLLKIKGSQASEDVPANGTVTAPAFTVEVKSGVATAQGNISAEDKGKLEGALGQAMNNNAGICRITQPPGAKSWIPKL
jgi:hypothetical protein